MHGSPPDMVTGNLDIHTKFTVPKPHIMHELKTVFSTLHFNIATEQPLLTNKPLVRNRKLTVEIEQKPFPRKSTMVSVICIQFHTHYTKKGEHGTNFGYFCIFREIHHPCIYNQFFPKRNINNIIIIYYHFNSVILSALISFSGIFPHQPRHINIIINFQLSHERHRQHTDNPTEPPNKNIPNNRTNTKPEFLYNTREITRHHPTKPPPEF
jgi:hypothetical protein